MRSLVKLTLISLLAGCSAIKAPTLIPEERKVEVSPVIMQDCGTLKVDLPKDASFADVLIAKAEDAKTFNKCKALNASKKKIIEEYLINERQD